jgi:hypothetical protein
VKAVPEYDDPVPGEDEPVSVGDRGGAVGVDVVAAVGAAVDSAEAGAAVNDGLRSFLPADVPFTAEAAGAVEVAESADSAVPVFLSATQVLSPEVIASRLPCRSLLRPLSSVEPEEPVDHPFPLPIVSAGSGTVVLDPASALSSSAVAAGVTVASSSSEAEDSPLVPPARFDAPDRELPVLVRGDDMMPLSTIVFAASPSGSAFRFGGAMMSGG